MFTPNNFFFCPYPLFTIVGGGVEFWRVSFKGPLILPRASSVHFLSYFLQWYFFPATFQLLRNITLYPGPSWAYSRIFQLIFTGWTIVKDNNNVNLLEYSPSQDLQYNYNYDGDIVCLSTATGSINICIIQHCKYVCLVKNVQKTNFHLINSTPESAQNQRTD